MSIVYFPIVIKFGSVGVTTGGLALGRVKYSATSVYSGTLFIPGNSFSIFPFSFVKYAACLGLAYIVNHQLKLSFIIIIVYQHFIYIKGMLTLTARANSTSDSTTVVEFFIFEISFFSYIL